MYMLCFGICLFVICCDVVFVCIYVYDWYCVLLFDLFIKLNIVIVFYMNILY